MTDDPRRRRPRRGGDDSSAPRRRGKSAPDRRRRSGNDEERTKAKRPRKSSHRTTERTPGKRPQAKRRSTPTRGGAARPGAARTAKSAGRPARRMTPEQQRARRAAAVKAARARDARRRRIFTIAVWVLCIGLLLGAAIFVRAKFQQHQQNLIEAQSATKEEIVRCTPDMLDMSMSKEGSVAGQPVTFDISVKNTSDKTCSLEAGSDRLILTVTSGEDHIWASHECREPEPDLRVFGPGVSSHISIAWDGGRTNSSCQDLPLPLPGVYVVSTSLDGKNVPDLRDAFELTGPDGTPVEVPEEPDQPVDSAEDADSEQAPIEEAPAEDAEGAEQ